VSEVIENAVNLIVNTADRSGNLKKDLQQTIFDTVSTLRDFCVQLKTSRDSKSQSITRATCRFNQIRAGRVQSRYG